MPRSYGTIIFILILFFLFWWGLGDLRHVGTVGLVYVTFCEEVGVCWRGDFCLRTRSLFSEAWWGFFIEKFVLLRSMRSFGWSVCVSALKFIFVAPKVFCLVSEWAVQSFMRWSVVSSNFWRCEQSLQYMVNVVFSMSARLFSSLWPVRALVSVLSDAFGRFIKVFLGRVHCSLWGWRLGSIPRLGLCFAVQGLWMRLRRLTDHVDEMI